jgi:glycosyltransferase involved in cell wall biosynthesis
MEAEPGRLAKLRALAGDLGLADCVSLPGPVSGEAKARWWARTDAFCLPSHDEGLPMSMLEAMAHAIPVVVTRVGSIPDAVEDGRHGLLYTPGDVEQLHQHLHTLLTEPTRARTWGLAGRARVAEAFSLDASSAALLALYRELA